MVKYKHIKTGGLYEMLGVGQWQADTPLSDMAEVVIYRGENGLLWVRDKAEFEARFESDGPKMDPNSLAVGDTIAESSRGEGAITGFHTMPDNSRIPQVNGRDAFWLKRTDGVLWEYVTGYYAQWLRMKEQNG